MRKYLPFVGMTWLVAVVFFAWGAATVAFKAFPYGNIAPTVQELRSFLKGHPSDKRSLFTRLQGELHFDPLSYSVIPSPFPLDLPLEPVATSSYQGPPIRFLGNARYYSDGSLDQYFLIYGSFAFEDTHWGAVLISSKGEVLRGWSMLPQEHVFQGGHIGLALSDDGDLATNTNGVLLSYSWCGKKNWEAEWQKHPDRPPVSMEFDYNYHHDISYLDGRYYTLLGPEIVSVNAKTGAIEERIHAVDLIRSARDQDLSIFDSRFRRFYSVKDLNKDNLIDYTMKTPFHSNKVDVLSSELAGEFEDFEYGDMLVSMRALNLVFVYRPKTSKILWYRYGLTARQHDATFQRGRIFVFDNNPFTASGGSPRIVDLDLKEHSRTIVFDLTKWGARMQTKGNFEFNEKTGILAFTDDDNGRAVVGTLSAKPLFVFENATDSDKNLQLRNITLVSPSKYQEWDSKCN